MTGIGRDLSQCNARSLTRKHAADVWGCWMDRPTDRCGRDSGGTGQRGRQGDSRGIQVREAAEKGGLVNPRPALLAASCSFFRHVAKMDHARCT